MMKIVNILFGFSFFIVIGMPLFVWISPISIEEPYIGENRALKKFPPLEELTKDIDKFNKELDKYINDNIPMRKIYISIYHNIVGYHLYSPVSKFIRGKDNQVFFIDTIKHFSGQRVIKQNYNEIINGIAYIYNYYNIPFIFLLIPDKEDVLSDRLPNWIHSFRKRNAIESYREKIIDNLVHENFQLIDLYDNFTDTPEKYFNRAFDVGHYNSVGLNIAVNEIVKKAGSLGVDLSDVYNYYTDDVTLEKKVWPWVGQNSTEKVHKFKMSDNFTNIKSVKYGNRKGWTGEDLIINKNENVSAKLVLFSDSSLKSPFISSAIKKLKTKVSLTPFLFTTSKYLQTFNKGYIDYNYIYKVTEDIKPNLVIYQITERTLSDFPNDNILRILGRKNINDTVRGGVYNEYFVFPEEVSGVLDKQLKEITIDKNKFMRITKDFQTDSNGNIYISFRYKTPKSSNAVLEYSFDKEFKRFTSISQKYQTSDKAISFNIKTEPNKKMYIRFKPGEYEGKYVFYEIPELREKK